MAATLAIAIEMLVPNGVPRGLVAATINGSIAATIFYGIRRNQPVLQLPWILGGIAMSLFTVDSLGWTLHFAGAAYGVWIIDVSKLLAIIALGIAIAVLVYINRPSDTRDALVDGTLLLAGGGLMVWQWLLLSDGGDGQRFVDPAMAPIVFGGLAITLTIVAVRLFGGKGVGTVSTLALIGAATLSLASQVVLSFTNPLDPPRWTDATWLFAGTLGAVAVLHPSVARSRAEFGRSPAAAVSTRMLIVGAALLINPAIVWLHLLQNTTNRGMVLWIAVAVGVITLFGMWRIGELISEREEMRRAVENSERRFRSLVQHASDVIIVVDDTSVILYATPSATTVLGYVPSELLGHEAIDFTHPDDHDEVAAFVNAVTAEAGSSDSIEVRIRNSSGEHRHTELIATNLLHDPWVEGVVLTIRDVTERAVFEAQLQHQASHDALTGLANRVLFSDRVAHALTRTARAHNQVAVIFVDLDDFKTVNDSLGHHAGDELLRISAGRLQECLREADSAARLGGDEFAVLLEDLEHPSDAIVIAERILLAMRQPLVIEDRMVHVSATLGVAVSKAGHTADDLLRNADTAMFTAKKAGKGRYQLFEPEMHQAALSRLDLKADIRRALDAEEFHVYYQPIFDIGTGSITGFEALLRWDHPERGLVLPDEFIPLIEETGQIVPLGRWVLRQAFLQGGEWQRSLDTPRLTMSVNLSVRQFQQPNLAHDVGAALDGTGLEPSDVIIEITESVFLGDAEATMLQLARLRELGVQLAIDDFGTGYSALSYLQRFRVDIVKVDKSFVDTLGSADDNPTLTRGIVTLAQTLDIRTVAEGVERVEQLVDLRTIECSMAQGFYYAAPMPVDEIEARFGQLRRTLRSV